MGEVSERVTTNTEQEKAEAAAVAQSREVDGCSREAELPTSPTNAQVATDLSEVDRQGGGVAEWFWTLLTHAGYEV